MSGEASAAAANSQQGTTHTAPKSQSNNHIAVDKHSTRELVDTRRDMGTKEKERKKNGIQGSAVQDSRHYQPQHTGQRHTVTPKSVSDTDRQTDRVSGCCTIRASESAGERRTKMKRKDSSYCCTTHTQKLSADRASSAVMCWVAHLISSPIVRVRKESLSLSENLP